MNSPRFRTHVVKLPAAPSGNQGVHQTSRSLPEKGAARAATRSVAMPLAKVDFSESLGCGGLFAAGRPAPATEMRKNAGAAAVASGLEGKFHVDSPARPSSQQNPDLSSRAHPSDEDLGQVIDAWSGLPRNVRAGILAMIRATNAGNA